MDLTALLHLPSNYFELPMTVFMRLVNRNEKKFFLTNLRLQNFSDFCLDFLKTLTNFMPLANHLYAFNSSAKPIDSA